MKGYVYVLTNPSFREDWVKIGKSSREVDVRSSELDNTSVPLPFEIYATIKTEKYNEVEKALHRMIDMISDLRIRQNREFFNIAPDKALAMLRNIATLLDDAEINDYQHSSTVPSSTGEPRTVNRTGVSRPNFKFSMVGIKPGEFITFEPTGIQVKVASDNQVEYEDRLWKLSPFVGTYLPSDQQNSSGAYQGPKYFTYNGETLSDMRDRIEAENPQSQNEVEGVE